MQLLPTQSRQPGSHSVDVDMPEGVHCVRLSITGDLSLSCVYSMQFAYNGQTYSICNLHSPALDEFDVPILDGSPLSCCPSFMAEQVAGQTITLTVTSTTAGEWGVAAEVLS